ncbi:MAG: S8 family serine peptidase, partial [Planctomycetota bacterium]
MDDLIFLNDISILQSQSNAGNQDSRPQAWAKNVISVGGVRHGNNAADSDDSWSFGGSIGPANDGRIKPDIAAYYEWVWTSDDDPGGYTGGDDYNNFGGTSAATPIVAGNLGLIYQMWSDGVYGNPVGAGDVFDNRPHNTTAKALLLNSSKQWNFSGTGHDLTRVHQGWGKPDLRRSYDNGDETFVVNEEFVLADQGSASWAVTVPAAAPEFRATMVYADRAGTTSSSLHRINDLSLRVTSPSGLIYWGNNGLLAAMTSTTGGFSNTKDTVEQVIVASPEPGVWTVDVFADEVNQDTHLETPGVDADFALVVTPVTSWVGSDPLNQMSLIGFGTPFTGIPTQYLFGNAVGGAPVWLLASDNLAGSVFQGHDFDLGAGIANVANTNADLGGSGSFMITIPGAYSGTTLYLEAASLSGGEWRESAALQLDVQ